MFYNAHLDNSANNVYYKYRENKPDLISILLKKLALYEEQNFAMKRSKLTLQEYRENLAEWLEELPYLDKAENTVTAYKKAVECFNSYLDATKTTELDKLTLINYKKYLEAEAEKNRNKPKKKKRDGITSNNTINLRLTVINRLFNNFGYPDIKVDLIEDETSNVLTNIPSEKEYKRILEWADKLDKPKIKLIIETLANTGMRISELKFLTREALKTRYFPVTNKGKTRYVFIPKRLNNKLLKFCRDEGIKSGMIFHGRDRNKPISQSYIRREMKTIAGKARGINLDKIHPHAWRHFFSIRYTNTPNVNPYWLSDILGHSTKGRATTTDLYVRGSEKDLLKTVDAVEQYYYDLDRKNRKKK